MTGGGDGDGGVDRDMVVIEGVERVDMVEI